MSYFVRHCMHLSGAFSHCVSALRKSFTSLVVVDEVAESDLVKGNYVDVIKKAFSFVLYR